MAQAVSRRLLKAEVWFGSKTSQQRYGMDNMWHCNGFLFEYFSSTLSVLFRRHSRGILI